METKFNQPFVVKPAIEAGTVSLSKIGKEGLTIQIPDQNNIHASNEAYLTIGSNPEDPEWKSSRQEMRVPKTPETHPDDFDVDEKQNGVTFSLSLEQLEEYEGKDITLHYVITSETWEPASSKPLTLKITP